MGSNSNPPPWGGDSFLRIPLIGLDVVVPVAAATGVLVPEDGVPAQTAEVPVADVAAGLRSSSSMEGKAGAERFKPSASLPLPSPSSLMSSLVASSLSLGLRRDVMEDACNGVVPLVLSVMVDGGGSCKVSG